MATTRMPEIRARMGVWLIFGVVLGTLPVLLSILTGSLGRVLSNGELLISSAAIAGGALGELLYANVPHAEKAFRSSIGGFCIILCICNTAAFMAQEKVVGYITPLSWWLFAGTIIAGLSSTVMVAGR